MLPSVEGVMVDYLTRTKIPPDTKVEKNDNFFRRVILFSEYIKMVEGIDSL
jgi:hypothetical protein